MAGMMEGKAGLVTGAAGGIGRATAIALAREGASVLVTDLPARAADGAETVRVIVEAGGQARFSPGDVVSWADQQRLVTETVEAFGSLDFAHNNAGIELQATLLETTEEQFDQIMAVNTKGVWLGMKAQLPQMVAQGGGSIVNTSSLAGLVCAPALGAYVASKHAVIGLTKTAAVEFADQDIRVNAVCPAAIRTAMIEILPPERQAELASPQAIKRLGEPSEVAEAVLWLLSDRASFVTGTAMQVDAGSLAGI
jgi:NAD(P)-dependent dehydrogenase (short-subunit alcohol dehydrogenase family)